MSSLMEKKKKNESLRFENRGYIETKGRRCEIRERERERERERVLSLKCRYC